MAASEPETGRASPVTVVFPCCVALSISPVVAVNRSTSLGVVLRLVRDRSVRSPTPANVAKVCGLWVRTPGTPQEAPSSALVPTPSSGLSSVVERSPRGAKKPRLSEEDEDKDSVASSE